MKLQEVVGLHQENIFASEYAFDKLSKVVPELKEHILQNPSGRDTIDFANPKSVYLLNFALLKHHLKINEWPLKHLSLCPPIPSRADYIYQINDFLGNPKSMNVLDVGTGASLIYPILGSQLFHWKFVATEIDQQSIRNAEDIVRKNKGLKGKIEIRRQVDSNKILQNMIAPDEFYDLIICNPPFYKSREEHWNKILDKNRKLHKDKALPTQNFGGLPNELWCEGGEQKFVTQLIYDSIQYKDQIGLCSTLIADKKHLKPLQSVLEYHKVKDINIINLKHGQKSSRILCWRLK